MELDYNELDSMTLILTIANKNGICQSSDYQLTNSVTGGFMSDKAGSKQIKATFKQMSIDLAFTGIASSGTTKTVDFLTQELQALPDTSTLDEICKALADRCNVMVSPLNTKFRWLTLVLAVETVGKPYRVVVISNTDDWSMKTLKTKNHFEIKVYTVTKPFVLTNGYRRCVSLRTLFKLRALSRKVGNHAEDVESKLAAVNATAAQNSNGYVSEKCWVISQFSEGRMRHNTSKNIDGEGGVPTIMHGFDITEFVMKNFKDVLGNQPRLLVTAGVVGGPGDGKPMPPPEGEPRTFIISGTAVSGILRSSAGGELASIVITPLECVITARCNEEAIGPFATIEITPISPVGADFAALFPYPVLNPFITIDGTHTQRPWELPISLYVQNGVCHLTCPLTSRALRNIAFLSEDEELAIVVPTNDINLNWADTGLPMKETLTARVWWRKS